MKHILLLISLFVAACPLSVCADHVDPLLDGWVRHQEAPFNAKCPYYVDSNGNVSSRRCIVGCVATALESILSYHQQPIVLQEPLPAWSTEHFTTEEMPAGTTVDTRIILPDYGDGTAASVGMSESDYAESVEAVSQLSLMCGMMAQMKWGLDSSGANVGRLVEPLQQLLGWQTVEYLDSYCYTPQQWSEILKNELRHGRPVLYTGYTMNIAGHAFVVDGFDEAGHFHINWGYGGAYDENYYDITQMANFSAPYDYTQADVQQGHFCNHQALLLSPDKVSFAVVADSLRRDGREVIVESVTIDETPMTAKQTPLTVTVRNVSDLPLTTPLEIFTNAADNENIFEEGDYGALFGCTLQPGETATYTVQCAFSEVGQRVLRISPDDETILYECPIDIQKGSGDRLTFGVPSVSLAYVGSAHSGAGDAGSYDATFTFPVTNEGSDRSGSLVTFCMMPGEDQIIDGEYRHFDYYYLAPSQTVTKSMTFKRLEPGSTHNLVIRWPWTIRQQYAFTVPTDPSAIMDIRLMPVEADGYDLLGRRGARPDGGLLIHNGRKTIR